MTQHTDERDAYEHALREINDFDDYWLQRTNGKYKHYAVELGFEMFCKARLMAAQGEFNA